MMRYVSIMRKSITDAILPLGPHLVARYSVLLSELH